MGKGVESVLEAAKERMRVEYQAFEQASSAPPDDRDANAIGTHLLIMQATAQVVIAESLATLGGMFRMGPLAPGGGVVLPPGILRKG